jgi:hypothetical protein
MLPEVASLQARVEPGTARTRSSFLLSCYENVLHCTPGPRARLQDVALPRVQFVGLTIPRIYFINLNKFTL